MKLRETVIGALVCLAMAYAFADEPAYPDLDWKMQGSTARDACASEESQVAVPELALSGWDAGESSEGVIYRHLPVGAIIMIY